MPQSYIWYSPLAKSLLGGALVLGSFSAHAADDKAKALMRVPLVTIAKVSPTSPLTSAPKLADRMPKTSLTASSMEAAKTVEAYFNGMSSLKADFAQKVTGEAFTSEGTFVWKKPRQFVWTYDTPNRQRVIGTGTALYFVDDDRGHQVTQLPVSAGLARLFNAKTLNLAKEGLRVAAVKDTPTEYAVTLDATQTDAKDMAAVKTYRLVFDRVGGKLVLKALEATDITQATTKVTFSNVVPNAKIPAKTFAFTPGVYKQGNEVF